MRKLIAFDDDTLHRLTVLGQSRMATMQDLADEAFADLLKKHDQPIDLRDALKKSVRAGRAAKVAAAPRRRGPSKSPSKSKT